MKRPLVSIIIAVFNEEKYIEKCLLSLKKQNYKPIEIIIVNDGSTDKTNKVLSELSNKQINKLQIFKIRHSGPAVARNFGAEKAKGKILVFVDADMYFDKDFIRDLIVSVLSGKAKGTYSTEEYVANWENSWARCWNNNWNLPDKKRIDIENKDQQKDFRAILKSEFEKVKGFNNTGYTDTWTLSEKLGYKPTTTKALYYHYNPSSLKEVFNQAKWVAKRKYKLGFLGTFLAFIRANILFSIIIGVIKSVRKKETAFFIFKIVYDLGIIVGLLEYILID